ncbi:MAG: ABC transporter permease [Candidatus Woesearchaeota archaeon]|nr:ABC transporter permease [Candidatus Woesearchaeota archaeon]
MIKDYVKYAFLNLRERKTRTWLTMLGIFIGIALVVALISLGQGLQETINEQFKMLGVDKIIVSPGGTFSGVGGSSAASELKEKDIDTIKKVRGVDLAAGFIYKLARMKSGNEFKYSWATGMPTDESRKIIESMQSFKITEGKDLKKGDSYKALVGIMFSEGKVFKKKLNVGDKIEVEGKDFEIIGILGRIGNPQDDSQILIPLDVARAVLNEPEKYDTIIVQIKEGEDANAIAESIKKRLRDERNVKEGEEDFSIQTSAQLLETFKTVFTIVQAVLIGIAAISLLVGGIGIMNTMYTSVLERTQEIGVMKAIGAKNSDIAQIFLIESGLLGLTGGIIGVLIGVGLSNIVVYITTQMGVSILKAYFPWYLIVGSLLFSVAVGIASGMLPARQAALMRPADSLRYE